MSVLSEGLVRGWRSLSGSGDNELVPQSRLSGPMPWVIAIMIALKKTIGVRVSPEVEESGLDYAEHGERSYH